MPITVRHTGRIQIDAQGAARALAAAAIRHIRARDAAGVDAHGRALPEYSPLYQLQLEATGQSTKPHTRRSGRLLDDLQVLRIEVNGDLVQIVLGVGDGTSPRTPRPPPVVFQGTPEQQQRALERWRASTKKVTQSAPHPMLLELIVEGGPHRPGRDVIGISPEGMKDMVAELQRFALFK